MNFPRTLSLSLLVIVAVGCQKSYSLSLNPKQGETYHYNISVSGAANMSMTTSLTASKVDPKEVVFETKMGNFSMAGQALPPQVSDMFDKMVITVTEDHSGHTLNKSVNGVPEAMAKTMESGSDPAAASFPDHPVKVGDTWTGDTTVQGSKVQVNYKLASVDNVAGKEAAVIEATPQSGPVTFTAPMKMDIELATGMPVDMSYQAQTKGQTFKFSMTRT